LTGFRFRPVARRIPLIVFILSCAFLSFLYGVAVGTYRLPPFYTLRRAFNTIESWGVHTRRTHHLYPVVHDEVGAHTAEGAQIDGVTLLTSYWDGRPGIRLIDAAGQVLHSWTPNAAEIWPESPYDDLDRGNRNNADNYVHGSCLLPNGDVVFSIEYMGLARLDARGELVWRVSWRTHHSVTPTDDGGFWVCALRWVEEDDTERRKLFPGLRPPFAEDFVLRISADGKVEKQFSVLEALYEGGHASLIWKSGRRGREDRLHVNDVEALPAALAESYPTLDAGDLVVSMRDINAIATLDGQTGRIKWIRTDGLNMQHDPDFIGDGWIRVFNNNPDGAGGRVLGGSEIIDIRPDTGQVHRAYPVGDAEPFFTAEAGKAQTLHNGDIMITESRAGRVMQVDAEGRLRWRWIQSPWPDEPTLISEVLEGTRYPFTRQTIASWKDGSP
jgi:hypothetical protein